MKGSPMSNLILRPAPSTPPSLRPLYAWPLRAAALIALVVGMGACASTGASDEGTTGGSGGTGGALDASGDSTDGEAGDAADAGDAEASTDASIDGTDDASDDAAADGDASVDALDDAADATTDALDDGADASDAADADAADVVDANVSDACHSCSCAIEICNGRDDNCNGQTDDSPGNPNGPNGVNGEQTGVACQTGKQGVCTDGIMKCSNGTVKCVQTTPATTEICDGLDNDCDGVVDQAYPEQGVSCSTPLKGICKAGTKTCVGGTISCVPNFQPGDQPEVCNGQDDNCDGQIDEGNPGGGAGCLVAAWAAYPGSECAKGITSCDAGQTKCNQVNQPASEVCDGLDNDCNGQIDNGIDGKSCDTGVPGVCAAGHQRCDSSVSPPALRCDQIATPSAEQCDGIDNDCNGLADDADPNTMCPSANFVTGWACSASNCTIATCSTGHADIDLVASDGCECASSFYSTSCGSPTSVSVAWLQTVDKTGVLARGATTEAWFAPSYTGYPDSNVNPASGTTVHLSAQLADDGGGTYAMDVFQGNSCGTHATCNDNGSSVNASQWEFKAAHDGVCDNWSKCSNADALTPAMIRVRIYRKSGSPPSCTEYKVRFTNSNL